MCVCVCVCVHAHVSVSLHGRAMYSEKRLIKKCQDLVAEILSCQNKVRTADELSAGDQSTIESLRKEIGAFCLSAFQCSLDPWTM